MLDRGESRWLQVTKPASRNPSWLYCFTGQRETDYLIVRRLLDTREAMLLRIPCDERHDREIALEW